jgi:hypothetical protein
VIDRSTTRDTPIDPMAYLQVALLFGTHVAETILASAHVRAHQKAGHMDANDLIKTLPKHLAGRRPSTYGSKPMQRRARHVRWTKCRSPGQPGVAFARSCDGLRMHRSSLDL